MVADQTCKLRAVVRAGEVQGDTALAGVEVEERGASFGVRTAAREGSKHTRPVAVRRLDLDDIRAQVAEQLCAERGGDPLGDIQYLQPGERRTHVPALLRRMIPRRWGRRNF